MSEAELIRQVIAWVRSRREAEGPDADITAETDLIEHGLLDSLGLADLILFVESLEGTELDLIDADPAEFCVVGGLCRLAVKSRVDQVTTGGRR
jgi:acyl carrier protein